MTLPAALRAIADRSDGMWRDPDVDERWTGIDLPMRYVHGSFGPVTGCDPGIAGWVNLLRFHGIETVQSCEGGEGHSYREPTIDFLGDPHEGHYVVSLALRVGTFDRLRPWRLSRTWHLSTGEPDELIWQLVLRSAMRDGSSIEPDSASVPEADGAGAAGGGGTSTAPSAPIDAQAESGRGVSAAGVLDPSSSAPPAAKPSARSLLVQKDRKALRPGKPAFDPLGAPASVHCPDCDWVGKAMGLGTHRRKRHGYKAGDLSSSQGPINCPDCGESIAQKKNLARHRQAAHGWTPWVPQPVLPGNGAPVMRKGAEKWVCGRCTDAFGSREARDLHQSMHPPIPPVAPLRSIGRGTQ